MQDVLLLDYSPTTRRATRLTLAQAGFNVILAETVERALEALRRGWPDAVLVNTDIPGMNAEALCEVIHRENVGRSFAIFVVTPPLQGQTIEWAGSMQKCFVLEQPLSPEEIVSRLAEILSACGETRRNAH